MSEQRNPFDAFDPTPAPMPAGGGDNPFNQFDAGGAGSPMPAWLFENGQRANILNAFGEGAAQGWGADPLGLSDETSDFLKKAGIFNDVQEGHQSWLRTFNEAMIRPAAAGLEAVMRGGSALLRGGQAAVAALGEFAAHPPPGTGFIPGPLELAPGLVKEAAAIPEAFPRGTAELGVPETGLPAERPISPGATEAAIRALTPPDLAEARGLGVIGEGEAGWLGIPEPIPPEFDAARADAVKQVREAAEEEPSGEAATAPAAPPPAPDVHQLAREIAPDIFREYDALTTRRDTYRRWLDDLAETRQQNAEATAPNAAEIEDLQNRLQTATGRRAANWQNRLDRLLPERDAYIADQISRDSSDMAQVRQALQENDYRMRDLAEPVSAAYREARGRLPEAAPAEPVVPTPVGTPAPEQQAEQAPATQPQQPQPSPTEPPIEFRAVPSIHDDAYQQLVAAGRSPDEANAAAALVAAHYDARAARFGGALGTPEELYAREAPSIEAGAGRGAVAGQTVLRDGQATIRLMGKADASTFIHETGHAWLEELMRDAAHEAAPEDLTKDASTVREWLGVGDDETIPTRAHEKFARGFERYMMEGRAPSSGLARVFDQFKQWLTQIYQTVGRLRAPITDDIRDVFDRLIALPGREPVIAPDMTIPEDFAAEHEALVDRTAPEVAGGAADRIRAEADRVALEKAPEVYDELGRRSAGASGETSGNAPADRGPRGNGAETGTGTGEAPAPEPVGAQRQSGGTATAEKPRVAGPAATATPAPGPVDANATFVRPDESPLVDRAGNIRLDLLGTPEDINQVIRVAAAENNEFLGARRGVISDAEVLRLADALGMDASQLDRRKLGQAFNAEEVTAARKLLVQSANAVHDAMQKAATGTDQDVMAYAAAKDRHRMIQSQVSGITAEAGRALRAFAQPVAGAEQAAQIGAFIEEATGRTLNQLRREAQKGAALDTPSKVSKFVGDSDKPGFFDWLQSYFVNALISGPATHGTYAIGNTLLHLYKATVETGAQALVGAAREAITGETETDRVRAGEIGAQLYGFMGQGVRNGWRAAWDAFRTDQTVALPGEKLGPNYAMGRQHVIPGVAGRVIESPSRVIAAIHSWSRTTSYETSIAAQAYRIATNEGLSGDRKAARINFLTGRPTDEMMEAAVTEANENALMQRAPYRSLTSAVQRVTNWGIPVNVGGVSLGTLRPLKYIDPFVAISSNVIKSAVGQRTPLGLLSPEIRADLSGAKGTLAFDRAAGRMLAGTSFYLLAGGLAAEGLITGSAPDDYRKAMMKRMTGWQEHSVKIGDMYYAANRLGVLGMALGIGADLYDVAHQATTEDFSTAAWAAVHAFSQNILDESFMRGPSDLIRALTDHERYGPAFVRTFLSSFVPFSVGAAQIARTIDPYTRQARTVTDAMRRKIPFESEALFPMRDIWGEPMPNRESPLPGLTAIYESKVNNDPVNQRLVALGMGPALPKRDIRGVPLTDQQYDDYSKYAGRLAKLRLNQLVTAPGFTLQPEMIQRELISKTISAIREAVSRGVMMKLYPDIITKANAAKTAGLHTVH